MSPNVALLTFVVFIAAGFIIERRGRTVPVSAATWLPVLWMAVCASRSIGDWLLVSNQKVIYANEAAYAAANANGSPVDRNVLGLMIVIGLLIIYKRRAFADVLRNNKALLIFVLYFGVTVLWSDDIGVSFKRWIRLFGHFVMAGVLLSEADPLEAMRTVFRRCAYLLIPLSVVLVKYFPNIGVLYYRKGEMFWIGAAIMKNSLGHLALALTFVIVWELLTTRSRKENAKPYKLMYDVVVLTMGLWLLRGPAGASSSASIGSLIVGTGMLIGLRLPGMKAVFARSGTFLVVSAVVFAVLESTVGIVEMIVTALGRNMTFTDRVPLWGVLVDLGLQNPLFGYGYSGFWTSERFAAISTVAGDFNQAHNGYLELFVEGGFLGIALLFVMVAVVFRKIQRTERPVFDFGVLRLCFFVIVLIANVTESAFARERDLLSFVFFVIAMSDEKLNRLSTPATNVESLEKSRKAVSHWQSRSRPAARRPVQPTQQALHQRLVGSSIE